MTSLIIILFLLALLFFWQSNRQRKAAGLPGGRVVYTDTRGWGKVEKPLFYPALALTGKPDYLIEKNGQIASPLRSNRAAPLKRRMIRISFNWHRIVCWWKRPMAIVRPTASSTTRTVIVAIDYTRELESALIELIGDMREDDVRGNIARSRRTNLPLQGMRV